MHTIDGQGPALGEMQATINVESSLASEEASPKVQKSLAAHHRPPMSVVLIQESTESPLGTALNNEDSQGPPPPMVSLGSSIGESRASWQRTHSGSVNDDSMSTAPSCFSSFKLKPRNPGPFMSASPSRSGHCITGATRGRKRPAHSISIPVGTMSSAESPLRPPRPYSKDDRSDESSAKEESFSAGSDSTAKDTTLSPPIFEMECLNLKSLSLQSPSKTSPPMFQGNKHSSNRSGASSFTMYGYGVSPAGSVTRPANSSTRSTPSESTSSSFMASETPSSSARSSPRHVPLTVLSRGQSLMSPSMSSVVRPPRHGSGPSLLFSLDQEEDVSDDDDEGIRFPRKLPASSCNSSLSSEEADRKIPMFGSPSLSSTMYTSPIKTAASPKTPMPKIMLTPRTPQSSGSRRKAGLPMFPSPSDDGIDTTNTPQTHSSSIDEAMDNLLKGYSHREHPRTFQSTTGYIPSFDDIHGNSSRYRHNSSNSLAFSVEDSKGDAMGAELERADSASFLTRTSPPPTALESDNVNNTSPPALPRTWLLPPPSDSSANGHSNHASVDMPLAPRIDRSTQASFGAPSMPSTSKHDTILRAMMDANARARSADSDSLSDSGEDDAFVLTCPSTRAMALVDGQRPPKQRRRESHERALSSSLFNGGRESCTSLASGLAPASGLRESCTSLASGLASASSLFGMEFYEEEGHSVTSPLYRSTTPFSSHSLKSKQSGSHGELSSKGDEDGFAPLGMHRRSENSFGSLGLSLDGPSDAVDDRGRDLVTPPATRHVAFSPPPLPFQPVHAESFCSTPKSTNTEPTKDDSPRDDMDAEE